MILYWVLLLFVLKLHSLGSINSAAIPFRTDLRGLWSLSFLLHVVLIYNPSFFYFLTPIFAFSGNILQLSCFLALTFLMFSSVGWLPF